MSNDTPTTPAAAASPELSPITMPLCAIFRRFLKRQKLKFTPERAVILDAVLDREGVFEAEELLDDIRDSDKHRVSKATVYRTLKHLVDAKIIREVLLDSRLAHYELAYGRKPKGHLVCVETNRVIEFDAPELEALRDRISQEHGFDAVSHRFVIYGVSPEARANEQAERGEQESGID